MDIQQTDKNSFKTAHWRLRCGQRETEGGIEKLALSPLPVATEQLPLTINKFLLINPQKLLEIQGQSTNVSLNQFSLWGQIYTLGAIFFLLWLTSTDLLVVLPILILVTVILGSIVWLRFSDSIHSSKVSISPSFHPQKQQVLITLQTGDIPRPCLVNDSSSQSAGWQIFCVLAGAITFSSGWMLLCGGKHLTQLWLSIAIGSIIFGSFFLYFPIKPWIVYFFQSKKNPPQDHLAAIPWEEVSIEFHQLSAVSYVGPRSMYQLSIRCPLPDESERAFTIGLPVYSQQEAFCLYELIRDYMEHGAKGLEHTAAAELQTEAPDYGRAAYWREVKQHLKNPLTYPFWQLWSLISLRPFAHWYMEYLLDVLPKKNIHREAAIQWSQPIPESEWAKPSEQLQEANRRVRELYVKGLDWESPEVQAVLREYERV